MSRHNAAYDFVRWEVEQSEERLFMDLDRKRHECGFTEVDIARALDAFDLGDQWRNWCEDD